MDILFNVIPPPVNWPTEKVERKAYEVATILKNHSIKIVGIPEVIEETTRENRPLLYHPKVDNRVFGEMIKKFNPEVEILIFKITPIVLENELCKWLEETKITYKVNNIVFVGGESSKKVYPGPNPILATQKFKNNQIKIGGITVFSRSNEAQKLFEKTKAGMQFFISQIVFELENAKTVISQYYELCKTENIKPQPIYISIAPISKLEDYEFLKWLGVIIPPDIEEYLLNEPTKIEANTIAILEKIISQVVNFPWECGINVEHVTYNNLQLASYLIYKLQKIFS
jgi:5,10-methylenetetrahydrofolate reductase